MSEEIPSWAQELREDMIRVELAIEEIRKKVDPVSNAYNHAKWGLAGALFVVSFLAFAAKAWYDGTAHLIFKFFSSHPSGLGK